MQYLLDTDVISETRKRQPDGRVTAFLTSIESSALFVSVLTLGELRKGVAMKGRTDPDVARLLSAWVDGIEYSFADRVLGIDAAIARLWGEWSAQRPRSVVDTLLAATAVVRGLTLLTRNARDLEGIAVDLRDPWQD